MSVQIDATTSEQRCCSWSSTSLSSPAGEIVVLRVAGEIDMASVSDLRGAIVDALATGPEHLVVDLAELSFCNVGGMALLVDAPAIAARSGSGFAISAAPPRLERHWAILYAGAEMPTRYPSAAVAVVAVRAFQPPAGRYRAATAQPGRTAEARTSTGPRGASPPGSAPEPGRLNRGA